MYQNQSKLLLHNLLQIVKFVSIAVKEYVSKTVSSSKMSLSTY